MKQLIAPLKKPIKSHEVDCSDSAECLDDCLLSDKSDSSVAVASDVEFSSDSNIVSEEENEAINLKKQVQPQAEKNGPATEGEEKSGSATGGSSGKPSGPAERTHSKIDEEPATGGERGIRNDSLLLGTQPTLYCNGYFRIRNRSDAHSIRCSVYPMFHGDGPMGIGTTGLSKTFSPKDFGESTNDSPRTMLLARAWMLWRARQGGWLLNDEHRVSIFARETDLLLRAINRLQPQAETVLGNRAASEMLSQFVPDVVSKVRR